MIYHYTPRTVAQTIASVAGAYHRCIETANGYADKHAATLERIEKLFLPSGSGVDSGTQIDVAKSADDRITLYTSFHHMEEGYYSGWTEHRVTVRPAFCGLDITISGSNRNEIKDYLYDVFDTALSHELTRAEWFQIHGTPDPDTN